MDVDKLLSGLESNKLREYEENKKKLADQLISAKDHTLVHVMLKYFLQTRSERIIEVLYEAEEPQNIYILDRLEDWLKTHQFRLQALSVLCALTRQNATWLNAIKDHKLLKSIFKLIMTEKDVVTIMSALLCIITLLPILTTGVSNFLNDLFEVFAHLASWEVHHTKQLSDDKLVHLQLGLQMLFHRLYGMYPCSFISFLSEFSKKDKGGVWQHTIKPLLNTVRIHSMLLIDSAETEIIANRWSTKQPHDIESECAQTALPVVHPDFKNEYSSINLPMTPGSAHSDENANRSRIGSTASNEFFAEQLKKLQQNKGSIIRSDVDETNVWNESVQLATLANITLTPITSSILPLAPSKNARNLSSGTSPPEAAVEATPETTPLKDTTTVRLRNESSSAARAFFLPSQPVSPRRKEANSFSIHNNGEEALALSKPKTAANLFSISKSSEGRVVSLYDRRIHQILLDRSERIEEPPETTELIRFDKDRVCALSDDKEQKVNKMAGTLNNLTELNNVKEFSPNASLQKNSSTVSLLVARNCDNCNETEKEMCSEGGLHMPTDRVIQHLFKATKRRLRMATYCCNNSSNVKASLSSNRGCDFKQTSKGRLNGRLCKSCPSLQSLSSESANRKINVLQKSGKKLEIPKVNSEANHCRKSLNFSTSSTQTPEALSQLYENLLVELLSESTALRRNYEESSIYPQEILDQYILHTLQDKENCDAENIKLICIQLQYERYRRAIHAERNRRLLGRCRDRRTLEMERDIQKEKLKFLEQKNADLLDQIALQKRLLSDRAQSLDNDFEALQVKYLAEVEKNQNLIEANEALERRYSEESTQRREISHEFGCLKGKICDLTSELQQSHKKIERGLQWNQELARLEAEFITMTEILTKCRGRLRDVDNASARDAEIQILQDSYLNDLKELRQNLEDKTSELEHLKAKLIDMEAQRKSRELVISEQKRELQETKEEYKERIKALNYKYETQKIIILQLEEKYSLQFQPAPPDTERTDIASLTDQNSPRSASLASSESASVRSSDRFHQIFDASPTLGSSGMSCWPIQLSSSSSASEYNSQDMPTSSKKNESN